MNELNIFVIDELYKVISLCQSKYFENNENKNVNKNENENEQNTDYKDIKNEIIAINESLIAHLTPFSCGNIDTSNDCFTSIEKENLLQCVNKDWGTEGRQ